MQSTILMHSLGKGKHNFLFLQFKFSHRQKGDSHLGCRQRTTDETLATASFLPSSGGCACATAVVTSLIVSVYMNIK